MSDTNLITQTIIAGLQAQIDLVRQNLQDHENENYSTAHGGLQAQTSTYLDSAHDTVGTRVVAVVIGGNTYYMPANPTATGPCHSNCHSDCGCAGNCGCAPQCHGDIFD